MTSYVLGIYRIRDSSWRPVYREAQKKILPRYRGQYLVRSDGAWEMLEGKAPSATAFTSCSFPRWIWRGAASRSGIRPVHRASSPALGARFDTGRGQQWIAPALTGLAA